MCTRELISYFSTKTYVVGTQKNRPTETVLLSTQLMGKGINAILGAQWMDPEGDRGPDPPENHKNI